MNYNATTVDALLQRMYSSWKGNKNDDVGNLGKLVKAKFIAGRRTGKGCASKAKLLS